VPPHDSLMDIRSEMVATMEEMGITVEAHHHEVATGGQCEIDIKFDSLVKEGDKLLLYKYIVKNVALKYNKTVTLCQSQCLEIMVVGCILINPYGKLANHSLQVMNMPV